MLTKIYGLTGIIIGVVGILKILSIRNYDSLWFGRYIPLALAFGVILIIVSLYFLIKKDK